MTSPVSTDATRASAEAMSKLNRRRLLAGLASVSVAAPVTSAAGSSRGELERLIAAHAQATAVDRKRWDRAADISDAIADQLPVCRVQVGRVLRERNDDGSDTFTPLYAYTDADIEGRIGPHTEAQASLFGGPGAEQRSAAFRERQAQSIASKKAALAALNAERQYIEDLTGYTAAMEAARASADNVRAIEAAILALVPDTLEEAAHKAAWVVRLYKDDDSYLADDYEGALVAALSAIEKAVQS